MPLRHAPRLRQVVRVMARYGFGFATDQLGLRIRVPWPARPDGVARLTRGERLRLALQELGPTFVKLGQVLSTRPDLLPPDVVDELAKLQDEVPPVPLEEVRPVLEEDLGRPLEECFRSFDPEPLAAASLGQVHAAELADGRRVVVKVRRPGVERLVAADMDILLDLARLAERRTEWGSFYRVADMAEEFAATVRRELDFRSEADNARRLGRILADEPAVLVPAVVEEMTTPRVLVMERVEGIPLGDLAGLAAAGVGRREVAETLVRVMLRQALLEGFFHADPHPGNVVVIPGGARANAAGGGAVPGGAGGGAAAVGASGFRLALLDFGQVGRLASSTRDRFLLLVLGLLQRDSDMVVRAVTRLGLLPPATDLRLLQRDVEELREKFLEVPLREIQLREVLRSLFQLAYRHRIRVPSDLTLLGKAFMTLEGVVARLDPEVRVLELAEPFGRLLLRRQLAPGRLARRLGRDLAGLAWELAEVPDLVRALLFHLRAGTLPVSLDLSELERLLGKLDQVFNRLSLSVVLLSYSIIMAGVIIGSSLRGGPTLLWHLPVIEIGFFVASLLFLWLLWVIARSGARR